MTITSTSIMWTCLPNGVVTTATGAVASPLTLKLSLCVTPQFASAATDTINGTVFQNWPAMVRAITAANGWVVNFNSVGNNASSVTLATDYLSSAYLGIDGASLWSAIFPATTMVANQSANQPEFKIHSYDAGTIAKAVREAHRHVVATQAAGLQVQTNGSDPYSTLVNEHARARAALPRVAQALGGVSRGATKRALESAYQAETGTLGLGFELLRHSVFYDRGGHRAALRPQVDPVSPIDGQPNAVDFNTLLAHLGGQPSLLRKLGMIVDLHVVPPPNVLNEILTGAVEVTVSTAIPSFWGTAANVKSIATITACTVSASSFSATLRNPATSAAPSMISGMLPLSDTALFNVQIEDTEGTPMKLDVTTSGMSTPSASDIAAPLPALRTAGFTITQNQRDLALESTLSYQEALNTSYYASSNPGSVQLMAEDLIRGYRVDVCRDGGAAPAASSFQSLCLRDTRAYFPTLGGTAGTSVILSDEGYIKATAATSPIGAVTELDLHAGVFGWEGWSLASPRPGRAITATSGAELPDGGIASDAGTSADIQNEVPNQPTNLPAGGFPTAQLTVRARAATLPRLRFGSEYSFRARMTDLAGNDISVPNAVVASPPVPYLRYEPISNPLLVLATPLTEGEHVERLVIRSNPYAATPLTASAYATLYEGSSAPATPMNRYSYDNVRWIAPPKVAWSTAEAHGMFDVFLGEMSSAMKTGAPVAGVGYADTAFLAAKNALFALSQKESGTFSQTSVWNTQTAATVPNPVTIITPPTAVNAPAPTTRGNPLSPGQYTILSPTAPVYIPYFPDPNAAGVSLQSYSTNAAGQVTLGATMTRSWAPRSGCAWPEIDLPQIQLQQGTGATYTISGLDPAPSSNAPIVVSLPPGQQLVLQYSSTLADPTKMASYDPALDTAQVPAYAPPRQLTFVHAVQQPAPPCPPALIAAPRNQGQTNVALSGSIVADGPTSSQLDLVASWDELVDTELTTGVEVEANGVRRVKKTGRVQTWTMNVTDTAVTLPATPAIHHEFGDTKTRLVTYEAVATSRFREYFPAGLQANAANFQNSNLANTNLPMGTENPAAPIRIPATARPTHPSVLYVVPTYQWTSSSSSGTTTNTRLGGGLRVYVDRPWFTSGDTEYLAVLSAANGASPGDYVSQWGLDPIQFPQAEPLAPFSDQLVEGYDVSSMNPVPLAEGVGSASVFGYSPTAFDATRNLWYFDIEIAEETLEAPFVRLALARYQPNALVNGSVDLRLSTVVRADMVKLAADRTAAYVTGANNSVSVTVTGRVFANEAWTAGQATEASGRAMTAQVMESTAATPGEFDWYPVGASIPLVASQATGTSSTLLYFTGTVPMPAPTALKAGAKHQLAITEVEVFASDTAAADFPSPPSVMSNPTGVQPVRVGGASGVSRVLFSDVLPLPY